MTTINGKTYNASDFENGGHVEVVTAGTGEELIRFLAAMVDCIADASRARFTTSATSKNAGLSGSQSWVLAEDISYKLGAFVLIASRANPTVNYYTGQVTGYVSATKTLTVSVLTAAGSASSLTDWDVSLSGPAGVNGSTGPVRETNVLTNSTFAVQQRATVGSTDNSYGLDGVRLLLEAANAATISQDTADVPDRAKYAAKLTVGSANNNKFGIFMPVEGKEMWHLRGQAVSVRVPLKATAGISDVRVGILQFTGTEDAISGDPISSWGGAGSNPTLAANWAFANTPANLNVTTSWADYTIENVTVSASATNLALIVWCDDKTTTTTTDVLRVGGYCWLGKGSTAPSVILPAFEDELRKCRRYLFAVTGNSKAVDSGQCLSGTAAKIVVRLPVPMRTSPTLGSLTASHYIVADSSGGAVTCSALALDAAWTDVAKLDATVASGLTAGNATWLQTNNASAELLLTAEL